MCVHGFEFVRSKDGEFVHSKDGETCMSCMAQCVLCVHDLCLCRGCIG